MSKQSKTRKNPRRLMSALVVGLIGVLLLSVSAFAAYGSTSGYGKYKDAVKTLVTNTDNVTCEMNAVLKYDGKAVNEYATQGKIDGKSIYSHELSKTNGKTDYETFSTTIKGLTTTYNVDDTGYDQYESDYAGSPFFGETSTKLVNFAELLADTVLGDLKNNVVLVSTEDGISNYKLELSAEQIPAIVNAGIALMTVSDNANTGWVTYEDSDATYAAYYEETNGEALPEGYFDDLYENGSDAQWDQYNEVWEKMDGKYQDLLKEEYHNDVIINVKTDGSYAVYDSYDAYAEECLMDSGSIENYLNDNAVLTGVVCNFAINDDQKLVSNDFTVTFATTDTKGVSHQVEFMVKAELSDYGKTVVSPLDVGGRTLHTYE
ncbi:MAG TPA: hypothetical protein PKD52_00180 [Clostridiales bacterium]|nr:hypothetical protein [Clostridiales bacterium]